MFPQITNYIDTLLNLFEILTKSTLKKKKKTYFSKTFMCALMHFLENIFIKMCVCKMSRYVYLTL